MKNSNISIVIINQKGMGIGNIKRCYYLKLLLEKKFKIFPILIGNNNNPFNPFKKKILNLKKINSNMLIKYLEKNNIEKLIIDFYYFPKKILYKLRKKKIKLIKISDFKEKSDVRFYDLILNQYSSRHQNSKIKNSIIINPQINNYKNLKKKKKITIFFGFESNLNKIVNCVKAIEKIDYFEKYNKTLILFGSYKMTKELKYEFKNYQIKLNPSNFFKEISESKFSFGEAGTSAIERDILKIESLNFITNHTQINTPLILKNSKFAYFNKQLFMNNEKYFQKEIMNFLERRKIRKKSFLNFKLSKSDNIIKLIKKI